MHISGLQKLTLLDFPDKTAATIFTSGCNFRCPFCHNAELLGTNTPCIAEEEFFDFLNSRRGLLDGICISGGEPLLQPEIEAFCRKVKDLGFAIKLDTNGSFPQKLQALINTKLIDYVAMDVKNAEVRYAETCGLTKLDFEAVRESISLLIKGEIDYEFRTTVVRELHSKDDLLSLAKEIEGASAWYLQSFVDSKGVLAGPGALHAWPKDELEGILPKLQEWVPPTYLRGI